METGKYVWYVYDLRKDPIKVKIFRVYTDIHGDIRWVWSVSCDGRMIDDYVNMFSIRKPIVYGFE